MIYVEACESGSMFEGILKTSLNILAVTASNATESSFGIYCPGEYPPPPPEYNGVCLGDTFSVSWLEDRYFNPKKDSNLYVISNDLIVLQDFEKHFSVLCFLGGNSELHDMSKETLKQQYQAVKRRTGPDAEPGTSSHVSRFGSKALLKDYLVSYIGTNPQNENFTSAGFTASPISNSSSVNTRDIPLLYLKSKVKSHLSRLNNKQKRYIYVFDVSLSISQIRRSPMESPERQALQKKLFEEMNHRRQIDQNIVEILKLSLKQTNVLNLLISTRTTGQPLVDDWDCFKTLVTTNHVSNLVYLCSTQQLLN